MKKLLFLVIVFGSACTHKSGDTSVNVPHDKIVMQAHLRTDSLEAVLLLTPEQKAQVYDMMLKGREAEVACKPLKAVNHDEYMVKKKDAINACYAELKTVLTPEQQKKLDYYLPTLKCFKDFW